jgi:hypothetical protein
MKSLYCFTLLFILLVVANNNVTAQKLTIVKEDESRQHPKSVEFELLTDAVADSTITFVGTYQCNMKAEGGAISKMYYKIRQQAKKWNANSFKITDMVINDTVKEYTLVLTAYYANDSILYYQDKLREKNVVYVFGSDKLNGKSDYSFKVNNEKKKIKDGQFIKLYNKPGETIKLNKGGFTGTTVMIDYQADKNARFFDLGGFLISPYSNMNMGGIAINTGRISYVENGLGAILTTVLLYSEPE